MADIRDLTRGARTGAMGVAATVTRAPDGLLDTIDVEWKSRSDFGTEVGVREEDVRWSARGLLLPADGDDALLFVDSHGDPWALVWATGEAA